MTKKKQSTQPKCYLEAVVITQSKCYLEAVVIDNILEKRRIKLCSFGNVIFS